MAGPYVIDIETTGLDRFTDKINLVGIMSLDGKELYQTDNSMQFLEVANKIDLRNSLCIFHNAKFDTRFIYEHYGYRFDNVLDTIILFYLYNPYRKSYSLKGLVSELFKFKYDVSLDIKTGLSKQLRDYNAIDLQMTGLLFKYATERLSEKEVKLAQYLTKIDALYGNITDDGVLIDKERCAFELGVASKRIDELSEYIKTFTGEINLNSTQQLARVLFGKLGYKPVRKTEKGQWAVSSDVLKTYDTDLSRALVEYKMLTKLRSAFLEPYSNADIIHPNFRLTMTTSGRTSSANPNLQQLPRGATVRNLLKVPDDSYVFVEIDYSQMELRCAGHIAKIDNIIRAYKEDKDIHTLTAQLVSGQEEITEQQRFQAKAVNFGFLYGMGADKFVDYAKSSYGVVVSKDEAKQIRDNYFKSYPELNDYYAAIDKELKDYGYIENPIGRRKRLFSKFGEYERGSFINAKIQGFASDILLLSLLEISELPEYGNAFKVIGTVHDSILMYVKKDNLAVLDKIVGIMENPKYAIDMMGEPFVLPIKADVSIFEERWYGQKVRV